MRELEGALGCAGINILATSNERAVFGINSYGAGQAIHANAGLVHEIDERRSRDLLARNLDSLELLPAINATMNRWKQPTRETDRSCRAVDLHVDHIFETATFFGCHKCVGRLSRRVCHKSALHTADIAVASTTANQVETISRGLVRLDYQKHSDQSEVHYLSPCVSISDDAYFARSVNPGREFCSSIHLKAHPRQATA